VRARLTDLVRLTFSPGLTRQVQAVAVILLVGLFGLAIQQLIRTRAVLLGETETQMSRLAMVFAEQTGRALESVNLLLQAAAEDYRHTPSPAGAAPVDPALARRVGMVRQTAGMGIVDRSGRFVVASSPDLIRISFPSSVMALIRQAIEHPASGLRIGGPFRAPDGLWTAAMIRPAPADDPMDDAAAVALLNLGYFEDFYQAVELTEDGAILLHLRDGTVLARYPHQSEIVGRSYAALRPFRDILDKGRMAGTLIMQSPLDGHTRVLAIRALKAFPLAVNVSVGESDAMALWRRQAMTFGAFCAGIAVVATGLLLMLAGRTQEKEELLEQVREASQRMENEMQERQKVECALREAQRTEAVGRITGGVAHDFNNLLAIVLGNIDLLERTLSLNDRALGRLATMRTAVERGATLTSQLLAFARRQPLLPRPANLNTLVSGLRDLVQSAVSSRVKLSLEPGEDLPLASIDPAQMELVILNLAINARDAMPGGGTLRITTSFAEVAPREEDEFLPGRYLILAVEDTGVGMTPEVAARAFEPFYTTKPVGRGSGLGLSQVYGVARQLGGGARIESRRGTGTVVFVYLPPADGKAAEAPHSPTAAAPVNVTQAHLLVVDDDLAVRETTAALLGELGYDVYEAASGEEALEALACEPPIDVMLTDVVMPVMTGPELARRARASYPELPVPDVLVRAIEGALTRHPAAAE
jgi:signal transduction histidine kinase